MQRFEKFRKLTMNPSSIIPASTKPARVFVQARDKNDALTQASEIAKSLGKPLQRVDLTQIVSGYLRETEKHLLAVLDTAQETGAVLFFDEADALFGKQPDTPSGAPLDRPFFFECIENFSGPVIVATRSSRSDDRDENALQRLRFVPAQKIKTG